MNALRAVVIDSFGTQNELYPLQLQLHRSIKNSINGFIGKFTLDRSMGELVSVHLLYNQDTVFEGEVDHQCTSIDHNGMSITLAAKTPLDNNDTLSCRQQSIQEAGQTIVELLGFHDLRPGNSVPADCSRTNQVVSESIFTLDKNSMHTQLTLTNEKNY